MIIIKNRQAISKMRDAGKRLSEVIAEAINLPVSNLIHSLIVILFI